MDKRYDHTVLKRYLDKEGRAYFWPAKWKKRRMVLGYLTRGFKPDVHYTEKEVNEILNGMHTFGDHAMLRRGMCDEGLLDRMPDGSEYWLTEAGVAEKEIFSAAGYGVKV
jgi:hypothetical protein